jgi:uncharacterized membrane protein HdeD (DUF308 family)
MVELAAAMVMRTAGSSWMLLNAIVTFLLAATIGQRLPVSATGSLGVIFGVKMMCSGVSLVFSEDVVRKAVRPAYAADRMKKDIRVSNRK